MYTLNWSKIKEGKSYKTPGSRLYFVYYILHKDPERMIVSKFSGDDEDYLDFKEFKTYYKLSTDDGSATKIFWNNPRGEVFNKKYIKQKTVKVVFSDVNEYYIKNGMRL